MNRIVVAEECDATEVEQDYFSQLHKNKNLQC